MSWRRSAPLTAQLALVLAVLLAAIWGLAFLGIRHTVATSVEFTQQKTMSQARVFAEFTQATIKRLDTTLMLLRTQWPRGRGVFADAASRIQHDIGDIAFQVTVLNADGYPEYSTLVPAGSSTYMGDREHFRTHQEAPAADRLFISDPMVGRISGKWSIQFARPLPLLAKDFSGVILASVSPTLFEQFRDKLQFEESGSITLIKFTGQILARYPNPENTFLQAKLTGVPYLGPDAPFAGNFKRVSQLDGINRIFGYYRLPEYELIVVVGEGVDGGAAQYSSERNKILAGALAATLCAIVFVVLRGSLLYARNENAWLEAEQSRQLAESEAKLRALINQAVAGISMADNDGRLTLVNDYFCERTGYAREELLGMTILDIGHPEERAANVECLARMRSTGQSYTSEKRYLHKNGQVIWMDMAVAPLRNEAGDMIGGVAVLRDITERRRTEENLRDSERRWESVFRYSPVGMTITRIADGSLIDVNQSLCQSSGYTRDEMLGHTAVELGMYVDASERDRFLAPLAGGQNRVGHEFSVAAKTGARLQVLMVVHTINFNQEPCLLAAYFDNTARRKVEQEAATLRMELDRLMTFQVAKHTAMVMAHDLHQPLNAIATYLGAAQLMIENKAAPDKLRSTLHQSAVQVQRAGSVVRELLNYLERGRPAAVRLDLNALVRDTVSRFEIMPHDSANIICELADGLRPVNASSIEIERILVNLMQNSVEAMRGSRTSAEPVTITIRTAMDGSFVKVTVIDNGPGLDADARAHLFEPFWTSKPDGNGMGLAVSRSIIEAQGGKMWWEPDSEGASFHFTLPAAS